MRFIIDIDWFNMCQTYMANSNADNFLLFLDLFSLQLSNEFKIMILDNITFHKAKSLTMPDNIGLIFLAPCSQALNPTENVWAILKRACTEKRYKRLKDKSEFISKADKRICRSGCNTNLSV